MGVHQLNRNKAERGDKNEQFLLGIYYLNSEEFAQAFIWLKLAAQQDHPDAQFYLAYLYEEGRGTNVNLVEAFNWYGKAAEQEYKGADLAYVRLLIKPGFHPKLKTKKLLSPELLEKIHNNRIHYVNLSNVDLCYAEIILLCNALANNTTMTHLLLNGCKVDDARAEKLANALTNNIKRDFDLGLSANKIGDAGANALAKLKISKLDLRYNTISEESKKILMVSEIDECLFDPIYVGDAEKEEIRDNKVKVHRFFASSYHPVYNQKHLEDYQARREMTQLIVSKANLELIKNESPSPSALYQFDARRSLSPTPSSTPEFNQASLEKNDKQKNILHSLVEFGEDNAATVHAIYTVLNNKINIDERDDEGCTPLQRAVRLGKLNIIHCLVKSFASLTSKDNKGRDINYYIDLIQNKEMRRKLIVSLNKSICKTYLKVDTHTNKMLLQSIENQSAALNLLHEEVADVDLTEEQRRKFYFFHPT